MSISSKTRILKKIVIGIFLALTTFLSVCLAALFLWVMTGPRSINSITPYIESALSSPENGYKVKIENSEVVWDGWNSPLGIRASNVEIINDKGAVLSYFPHVLIRMYVHKLLIGELDVKTLELDHPSVTLVQNDDGSFVLSSSDKNTQTGNSVSSFLPLLLSEDRSNPVKHLKLLIIRHASLSIENKLTGQFLQSSDASLDMTRKKGKVKGSFNMPVIFGNIPANINADFGVDRKSHIAATTLYYKNIPTSALHQLFPSQKWLESINLSVSGSAQMAYDFAAGTVSNIDFMLESGQGNIKYPELLEGTLNLQGAKVTGSITDNLNTLKITSAKVSAITSTSKTVDLLFNLIIRKVGNDYGLDGYGQTANAPVNDIHLLWPITLSPVARKWVITHVSNGIITKADVTLHFKPGELKLKDVPESAVASTIVVKNTTIKYLPSHPPVTDVNAIIKFTGKAMDAKVSSAKYIGASQINSATVTMPNMYPDDVRMFIDLNATAPAQDVAAFLMLPKVEAAESLGITKNVTGVVTGNVKLNFIAFSVTDEKKQGSDMHYSVDGNLTDVSQNRFLDKYDISNANMNVLIDNKDIKLSGKATINTVPMSVDLHSNFDTVHKTAYSIACNMPLTALPKFGFPALDAASGTIGVNASFSETDTAKESSGDTKATLDLTGADISLPEYGFTKKSGDKLTLNLTAETLPSGDTLIKSLQLAGNNTDLSGSGEYNKVNNEITALKFDKVKFGNNDLNNLDYQKTADGIKLVATGNSFDLSPYMNGDKNKSNDSYNVDIETNRLIFGSNKQMQSAVLKADCTAICNSVNMSARLPSGAPFSFIIKGGTAAASTSDAGELLSALAITDTVTGGNLILTGKYNGSKLEGHTIVRNYTLKKAPILTKMLTIASLTGFLDTLSGKGISFKKLYAPFTYGGGVIVLKDAKAYGDALGITANGTIDNTNSTLDLNGLLIPSYTMNTLIGNVPVIGNLLMGGKGKGIFGMNYAVKGKMSDPSIRVNPLSVLTPGFLRGIFDVFDEPPPDIDKIMSERRAEDAKKADPSLPPLTPLNTAPPPQ